MVVYVSMDGCDVAVTLVMDAILVFTNVSVVQSRLGYHLGSVTFQPRS